MLEVNVPLNDFSWPASIQYLWINKEIPKVFNFFVSDFSVGNGIPEFRSFSIFFTWAAFSIFCVLDICALYFVPMNLCFCMCFVFVWLCVCGHSHLLCLSCVTSQPLTQHQPLKPCTCYYPKDYYSCLSLICMCWNLGCKLSSNCQRLATLSQKSCEQN